ncbi:PAS domain S-box protein [uncultured Thiodictyon sp.]|uniref:PAS domain S-box protein n=1 Tax=uncultured Thiodictyon sp. TaxID=1846217 RepID=UPI0025DFE8EC|nr:PAS domain S-box protein [uncultured Thiodictyon sp.]
MAPGTLSIEHPRRLLRLRDLRAHPSEFACENAERHRPGPALAAAAQHFFDLYELAPVGYLTVNEAGLIQTANHAATHLLGAPKSEIVQQPFCGFVLPEDRVLFDRHHHQALTTRTYPRSELRLIRANADIYWARLDGTVHHSDDDPTPLCLLVISDISQHKQMEQDLLESRELLELFMRHSPISSGRAALDGEESLDWLLERANRALYQAKTAGRISAS